MIDLTNNLIILIDGFGFAFFCTAFYFGLANYKNYDRSRALWALFNIAMFAGAIMALYAGVGWMEFYPAVMDAVEDSVALVLSVLLFTFCIVEKEESAIGI